MTKDLLLVTWRDAVGRDGWMSKQEIEELNPWVIHSVGWILKQTEDMIIICGSKGEEKNVNKEQFCHVHCIPAEAIVSITKLEMGGE